ncbi:MAG: AmmeMemoRadiSam system protein B [Rhodothermales bacterium]
MSNRAVYATQPRPLQEQLSVLLKSGPKADAMGEILAVIVPDANLLAGGEVAAYVYRLLEGSSYDTVVLVAPSHTGEFGRISICSVDEYRTALGNLSVNDRLRNELCDEDDDIFLDNRGHFHTEGVDVQLPFLQSVLASKFDIVPIVMGDESPEFCRELGHAIGEVMFNRRVLVVASANIIEAAEGALDTFVESFERGDISRLMTLMNSETVRVEGKGPIVVAVLAAVQNRANYFKMLSIRAPQSGTPGYIAAVLCRA